MSVEGRKQINVSIGKKFRGITFKLRGPIMKGYEMTPIPKKAVNLTTYEYISNFQFDLSGIANNTIKISSKPDIYDQILCQRRRRRFIKTATLHLLDRLGE